MSLAAAPANPRVLKALVSLAIARQADFEDDAQRVYLHVLGDCDAALVARACEQLAREPRGEFESAMPAAAVIRERVRLIAIADTEAAAVKRLAPMPAREDDEPTFHCRECHDEPNAWRPFWCPGAGKYRVMDRPARATGARRQCARPQPHEQHGYVERCECSDTNPVIAAARQRFYASRPKRETKSRRASASGGE